MSKKNAQNKNESSVQDYRYDAKRKNNPPAGLAAQGRTPELPKITYAYNPHRPPVLRFDDTGEADRLPELLETARQRALTAEEARILAEALRTHEPYLEWSGKREQKSFAVDPVALHIHERISTQAILKILKREDAQRDLFADPQQDYREAVQFYQHDVDWANRLILGDSLQVMASLVRRENLAGKVQMIYIDPPYGIKFASNFQPEIGKLDVKDKKQDLTHEPEVVKAYRDTWTLGVHSYLAYLRDRLYLAKELLHDSGSIFVQISDENLHRVRMVMDEVFGSDNFQAIINFKSTSPLGAKGLPKAYDYIIWYSRDVREMKFYPIFRSRDISDDKEYRFNADFTNGNIRRLSDEEFQELNDCNGIFRRSKLTSSGFTPSCTFEFFLNGHICKPHSGKSWATNPEGMARVIKAERLFLLGHHPYFKRYFTDSPVSQYDNCWTDQPAALQKIYVVMTAEKFITRCLLMTTDPGDLVLDPTCGSGTTAYVAEAWGRRWITIDSSRVAVALARQRLLTASFEAYELRGGAKSSNNPANGFIYETVPHITLKSIAQNVALDSIFAKHQPILDEKLNVLNQALSGVTPELRQKLQTKLTEKEKRERKKSITDADRRRWFLPKEEWKEWEVPFDVDDDYTDELKTALTAYRAAWRAKMDEVNAAIEANAEQEELVDKPKQLKGIVRVSGAFTVEAVKPAEESFSVESPIEGVDDELETFDAQSVDEFEPVNAEAYLDKMLRLLRADGVRFPNNNVAKFTRLESIGGSDYIQAEGEWESSDGQVRRVGVSFGSEHGSVTAYQVEEALRMANRRGFDELVFAGFSFDAAAQAVIQDDPNPNVRCHLAQIRPDVNMGGLLKDTPNSQIFTVFGSPRTKLEKTSDGMYIVEMQGVDIYNPVDNTILPTNADKVAAWFVDSDYDGRTFCITQAFFPHESAWGKLKSALKGTIEEDAFKALSSKISLPFPAGKNKRVAVKVIDPRGNEVMSVHRLD